MREKYSIVTGASTGIGRSVAVELAKNGATIHLVGRNKVGLEETKRLVEEAGGTGWVQVCDLSDVNDINKLVEEIKKQTDFKDIDVLVNVAGVWHDENKVHANTLFEDFKQEVILNTMNVGITAPMLLVNALLPEMEQKSSIINISGTFENGAKGWLPYYVSKRAIEDFTVGLSQDDEVLRKEIKVNCISPSDTATEEYKRFFPEDAEGAQTPEDIARLLIEVIDKDATGKVYVIKNGKVEESFHI